MMAKFLILLAVLVYSVTSAPIDDNVPNGVNLLSNMTLTEPVEGHKEAKHYSETSEEHISRILGESLVVSPSRTKRQLFSIISERSWLAQLAMNLVLNDEERSNEAIKCVLKLPCDVQEPYKTMLTSKFCLY